MGQAKKKLALLLSYAFFNFILLFFIRNGPEFENGVYSKYLNNILKNHDFNILTQFTSTKDIWMVTPTFNHFDYHSPFLSVVLFVPTLFFEVINRIIPIDPALLHQQIFITLTLLTFLFVGKISFDIFKDSKYFFLFILQIFLIGTSPVALFNPSELSFIQIIFSFFIFINLFLIIDEKSTSDVPLILTSSFFILLKFDGYFYLAATLMILILLKRPKSFLYLSILGTLNFLMIALTNKIRFDQFFISNPIIFLKHTNYFVHCLIGKNGWITKAPFLLVTLAIMLYQIMKGTHRPLKYLNVMALTILLFKGLSIGTGLVPVADYRANRVIITEIPFFAFSLYYFLYDLNEKYKPFFKFIFGLFTLYQAYTFVGWFLLIESFDFRLSSYLPIHIFIHAFTFIQFSFINSAHYFLEHKLHYLLLCFSSAFLLMLIQKIFSFNSLKKYSSLVLISYFISITFFFSNILVNQKNIKALKQEGRFKNSVVLKDRALFYDEVIDMIDYGRTVAKATGTLKETELNDFEKKYLEEVKNNIVSDPIGFKKMLTDGNIRKSFWEIDQVNDK